MKLEQMVLLGLVALGQIDVAAQELSADSEIQRIVRNATHRMTSRNNFDAIPLREKLYYAFRDIVIRSSGTDGPVVDSKDLELLMDAQKRSNFVRRAYAYLQTACKEAPPADALAAAMVLKEADALEFVDQDTYLRLTFDQLSQATKDHVLEIVDGLQGSGGIAIATVDYEAVASQAPGYVLGTFENMCKTMDGTYFSDLNPANTGTSISLTVGK